MSSHRLSDWLRTRSADQAGTETGHHVLQVLGKRRTVLTADDARVMSNVVDRIAAERREDLKPTAGRTHWRHRLMTIGHDPLEAA